MAHLRIHLEIKLGSIIDGYSSLGVPSRYILPMAFVGIKELQHPLILELDENAGGFIPTTIIEKGCQ